jgi:hypothetical protein
LLPRAITTSLASLADLEVIGKQFSQPLSSPGRRGKAKAMTAVARSILIIIWHLLSNPDARYTHLGYGYHQGRLDTDRKLRNHIRQTQALGSDVTITKAA